jgi:serine/threonine protein kinase
MGPERWRQVEELYHAASQLEASKRDAFLREACQGDDELISELESLLRQETSLEGLFGWNAVPDLPAEPVTRLQLGDELGPYRIVAAIGSGGMGDVYKAHDPRVGRDVAIKVSRALFTDRFEREARAVGSLNHPNICHLYDLGSNYLVMEYVDGPTLAQRLKKGPIPLGEALCIASQIANALEEAHEKSIVHRDLKPSNVKIKHDGIVKVLDFGLAKVSGAPAPSEDSSTRSIATQPGVILGTAAYMSPEQAKGKPVDKRTDIYSFGLVLYEMLTGRRLHQG